MLNKQKVLNDIIQSAICMKAHYDIWWAFVHDGRLASDYKRAMLEIKTNDFIRVTENAHYTSAFVYFANLYDKRKDVSSIPNYLSINPTEVTTENDLVRKFEDLSFRAKPILKIRHKLIAHIDNQLSESEVFHEIGMTWNDIGKVLYDTAEFVALIVGSEPCSIGIPRNGRMSEAVLDVLSKLTK